MSTTRLSRTNRNGVNKAAAAKLNEIAVQTNSRLEQNKLSNYHVNF